MCILLCILAAVFFMMAGDPALQSDGHNRDRQLFLSYRFLADAFARLRYSMSRDHQQIGRGFAILHQLTEILEAFRDKYRCGRESIFSRHDEAFNW